jgi:hypothetical protein
VDRTGEVARHARKVGFCTPLLYGMTGASKNTVKIMLTSAPIHSRLRRQ